MSRSQELEDAALGSPPDAEAPGAVPGAGPAPAPVPTPAPSTPPSPPPGQPTRRADPTVPTASELKEEEKDDDEDLDPQQVLKEHHTRMQQLYTLHLGNRNDITRAFVALGVNEDRARDVICDAYGKMAHPRDLQQTATTVSAMEEQLNTAQTIYKNVEQFGKFASALARLSHLPVTLDEDGQLGFGLDRNVILIGRNGVGKSSLLMAAANARPAYAPPTFHVPAQLDVDITAAAPSSNGLCELIRWACASNDTVGIVQPVLTSVWGELDTGKELRVEPGRLIVNLHSGAERVFGCEETGCIVEVLSGRERRSALSDGELRALYYILIALKHSREHGTCVIVLDEPETNMNAALSAPLLKQLVKTFADVCWTLVTHDFYFVRCLMEDIPQHDPKAFRVLLMSAPAETLPEDQSNMYAGTYRVAPVPLNSAAIADQTLRLLFGRRPVVLCEGTLNSDMKVYSELFPWLEFRGYGGCEDIISALNAEYDAGQGSRSFSVAGKLSSRRLMGLIDRDNRDAQDVNARRHRRVMVLDAWGIEGLLLSPACIEGLTDEPIEDLVGLYRSLIDVLRGTPDEVVEFMALRRHTWQASSVLRRVVARTLTQNPDNPRAQPKFPKMQSSNVEDKAVRERFKQTRREELKNFRKNRNDVIWPVLEDPEVHALAEEKHFRPDPPEDYDEESLSHLRSFYCDLLRRLRGHTIVEMMPDDLLGKILRMDVPPRGGKQREAKLMDMVVERINGNERYAEGVRKAVLGIAGSDDPPSVELHMSGGVKAHHFEHPYNDNPVAYQRENLQRELHNESYGLHFKRPRVVHDVGATFLFGVPGQRDVSTENYLLWDVHRDDAAALTDSGSLEVFTLIVNAEHKACEKKRTPLPPDFAHNITILVATVANGAARHDMACLEFACCVLRTLLIADNSDERFKAVAIAVVNLAHAIGLDNDDVHQLVAGAFQSVLELLDEPTRACAAAHVVCALLRKLNDAPEETQAKWDKHGKYVKLGQLAARDSVPPEIVLICAPLNITIPEGALLEALNNVEPDVLATHVKYLSRDVLVGCIPGHGESFVRYVLRRALENEDDVNFVRTVVPATMQAVQSLKCSEHERFGEIRSTVEILGETLSNPSFVVAQHHIVSGLYAMHGATSAIDFTIVTQLVGRLELDNPVAVRRSMVVIDKLLKRKSNRRWVVSQMDDGSFGLRHTEHGELLRVRLPRGPKAAEALRDTLKARRDARVQAVEPPQRPTTPEPESESEDDQLEYEYFNSVLEQHTTPLSRGNNLDWGSITFGAPANSPDVYAVRLVSSFDEDWSQWTGHFYFDLMVCPAGHEHIDVTHPALDEHPVVQWGGADPLRVIVTVRTSDAAVWRELCDGGAVQVAVTRARSGEDIQNTLLHHPMGGNWAAALLTHCVARDQRRGWADYAANASLLYETHATDGRKYAMYELWLRSFGLNVLVRDDEAAFVVAKTEVQRDVVAVAPWAPPTVNDRRPATLVDYSLSGDTSGRSIYHSSRVDDEHICLAAKTIVLCIAVHDPPPQPGRGGAVAVPLTPQSTNKRTGRASFVVFTREPDGLVCIRNVLTAKQFLTNNARHARPHWLE